MTQHARPFRGRRGAWPSAWAKCGPVIFFCLLASYYIFRPVRDEIGIHGGFEQPQWSFTATCLVMLLALPLFGAAAARLPRQSMLPAVYWFFIANLLEFFLLLRLGIAPQLLGISAQSRARSGCERSSGPFHWRYRRLPPRSARSPHPPEAVPPDRGLSATRARDKAPTAPQHRPNTRTTD